MTADPRLVRRSTAEVAADVILAILAGPPVCMSEINRRLGIPVHKDYAQKYVRALHDKRLIHIAEWKGCNSPRYAWSGGLKDDAPRPTKKQGEALRIHATAQQRKRRMLHRGYTEGTLRLEGQGANMAGGVP